MIRFVARPSPFIDLCYRMAARRNAPCDSEVLVAWIVSNTMDPRQDRRRPADLAKRLRQCRMEDRAEMLTYGAVYRY